MLDRKVRKKVEWAFYNYDSLKTAAEEHILAVADRQLAVNYDKLPVNAAGGNGVEAAVIKAIDGAGAYRWCKVVEQTLAHFAGTGKDTLVRLKYFEKQRERQLCCRLYVERWTLFRWLEDVLTYAAMVGLQETLKPIGAGSGNALASCRSKKKRCR